MLMTLFSWFTVPTASDIIASSTTYSTDMFSSLTFILGIAIGVPVAILAVKWLIGLVRGSVGRLFRGRRGGRRRGRR